MSEGTIKVADPSKKLNGQAEEWRGQSSKIYDPGVGTPLTGIVCRKVEDTWNKPNQWTSTSPFLIDSTTTRDILKPIIENNPTGLIVICGATGSGKTTHAHCLMRKYIDDKILAKSPVSGKPGTHIVTSEDQFEGHLLPFIDDPTGKFPYKIPEKREGLTYTPRLRNEGDSNITAQHLTDALRQKPDLVYMGEVRMKEDWQHIIKFAGTGHLAVATAHATGLKEMFATLLQSLPGQDKYWRSYLADRICAVVHVRQERSEPNKEFDVLYLRYWRGTPVTRAEYAKGGDLSIRPVSTDKTSPNQISYATFARRARQSISPTVMSNFMSKSAALAKAIDRHKSTADAGTRSVILNEITNLQTEIAGLPQ